VEFTCPEFKSVTSNFLRKQLILVMFYTQNKHSTGHPWIKTSDLYLAQRLLLRIIRHLHQRPPYVTLRKADKWNLRLLFPFAIKTFSMRHTFIILVGLCLSNKLEAQFDMETNNGTLTITHYYGDDDVVIPSTHNGLPVTGIGNSAFNTDSITSIYIPTSITNIGISAFYGCSALTNVFLPHSIASIGDEAFCDCAALKSITVDTNNINYSSCDGVLFNKNRTAIIQYPNAKAGSYICPPTVAQIKRKAFHACSSLTNITFSDSLTSIDEAAFSECSKLEHVVFPDSLLQIGDFAFYECDHLSELCIPNNSTNIGVDAFRDCTKLSNLIVGGNNTHLQKQSFFGCNELTNVVLKEGIIEIGESSFFQCYALARITFPNSLTNIDDWAFHQCSRLADITLPSNLMRVGVMAFSDCSGLKDFTIPSSLTHIAPNAFSHCNTLTTMQIPSTVEKLGDLFEPPPFCGCSQLRKINVDPSNPYYSSIHGVLFNKQQTVLIEYPAGKSGEYRIPDGVTWINDDAFSGCTDLENITIPQSVDRIGSDAFCFCSSLTDINIPNSNVKGIIDAFYKCTNLNSIIVGGIEQIQHSSP